MDELETELDYLDKLDKHNKLEPWLDGLSKLSKKNKLHDELYELNEQEIKLDELEAEFGELHE